MQECNAIDMEDFRNYLLEQNPYDPITIFCSIWAMTLLRREIISKYLMDKNIVIKDSLGEVPIANQMYSYLYDKEKVIGIEVRRYF